MPAERSETEERFLNLLQRAFVGWRAKIEEDFSQESFDRELASLESDDVYRLFGLAVPEYVLIRLMGRVSISIGRRIGELYDNLPKFVAAARFGLTPRDVAVRIDGLRLDVGIPFEFLDATAKEEALECVHEHLGLKLDGKEGLGIEIRYNFNPNDSARLRKDVSMAKGLEANNFCPIYLVFSGISPRDEAIQRLGRGGWNFLIGQRASDFTKCLLGLDLSALLSDAKVQATIAREADEMMLALMTSPGFLTAVESAKLRTSRPGE